MESYFDMYFMQHLLVFLHSLCYNERPPETGRCRLGMGTDA